MCGICGVVQIRGAARQVVTPQVLDRMTDALTHRGPNDRGTHTADGIALGARRLSIIDVGGGHQPVFNERRTIAAVQNGELYNHTELRRGLVADGHRISSRCDTEVLPHLYEAHGTSYMELLRGKFAIAVWDDERRRAVLTRDRLGVKPLYYAAVDDLLIFGSELKSVLASGLVSEELDYEGIQAYLTLGYFPWPRTPLAAVSKLPPGGRLIVADGRVDVETYWSYPAPAPDRTLSADDHVAAFGEALDEAVRLRLMSDVPLGAMLSGGLDSSLIVALMARHASGPVKTFAVGFAESGPQNELADARFVASYYGADHSEIELSLADSEVDLAQLAWALDEPVADLSALGFLALSELAARDVTVALSGQGADELLGGYRKHVAAAVTGRVPRPLRRLAGVAGARAGRAAAVLGADDPVSRLLASSALVSEPMLARLACGPLATTVRGDSTRELMTGRLRDVSADPLSEALFLDAQLGLVDDMLQYFDRASMAKSLEVRVPFLDHHVVELCARIPPELKVRGRETKHVLRRAAHGIVPDRIIHKPKIGFFHSNVEGWFRAQSQGSVSEYLLGREPRTAAFLDRTGVGALVRAQAGGDRRHSDLLLAVLMLEVWLADFLPQARPRDGRPAAVTAA